MRRGIEFDCFERHSDVGGIWDQQNPGSAIYDSAHFISSKSMSGFHGYPMPAELPDYPDHRQVLAYLRDFADAYGLRVGCGPRPPSSAPSHCPPAAGR